LPRHTPTSYRTAAMSRATLGIISIGDMGIGIAKLLIAHDYKVITNISGRRYACRWDTTAHSSSIPEILLI